MARKNIDDEALRAQNESQLELIKINVEKVKKDVSEVSTFTKKEIDSVLKKVDQVIAKMEKSNATLIKQNKSAYQYMADAQQRLTEDEYKASEKEAKNYIKYAERKIKAERELRIEQQRRYDEQTKYEERSYKKAAEYLNEYQQGQAKILQQQKENQNAISQALKGNFTDLFNLKINRQKEDISSQMDLIKKAVGNGDMSVAEGKKQMSGLMDSMKSIDASSAKMNAAATIFNTAVKVVKAFADIWIKRFFNGVDNIVNKYEEIYTHQAVQTGENQEQYFNRQKEMQQSLNKQGLQNNIAVTEVMQATADFVNNGITNMADAMRLGEQSAIAKQLAPYLDMQSDALTSLTLTFGPQFSKRMAGIAGAVSDTVGNNRFTTKNLSSIIDMLNPVMLASQKELLGADELAYLEYMKSKGMTDEAALSVIKDISDIKSNPVGVLEGNGSLASRILASFGEDYVMNADLSTMIHDYMQTEFGLRSGTSGYGRNAIQNATGSHISWWFDDKTFQDITENGFKAALDADGKELTRYETNAQRLANDELTTAKAQKDLLAESLAVETAILQERWPDLMNVLRDLLPGIAGLFATWLGGKLLGKIGGKLFGNIGGKAVGEAGEKALVEGAAHTGGLKTAMMGKGGGASAVALPAAGAVAGAGLGIYNGVQAANDFKNGETGYGIADTVGAVAGGTAAVTLGATAASAAGVGGAVGAFGAMAAVPVVGWIALAASAVVAGGVAIKKAIDAEVKQREAANNVFKEQVESEMKERKKSQEDYINDLYVIRSKVKQAASDEDARRILLENGIASQEELTKEQNKSRDALINLTDAYIADTKARNDKDNKAVEVLKNMQAKDKEVYANDAWSYVDWLLGDNGWNREINELGDQDREAAYKIVAAIAQYGENHYEGMSEKEKKVFDEIKKQGLDAAKEGNHDTGLNWESMDKIIDKMDSEEEASRALVRKAMSDGGILENYSKQSSIRNKFGKDAYVNKDYSAAFDQFLLPASDPSLSDKKAKSYLESFKSATGLSWDKIPEGDLKNYIQDIMSTHNIDSYAIGTPYNTTEGLAYLHEGEAVLTATAADILRGNSNYNISTAAGVNDALNAKSSLTTENVQSIVTAISNQTMQLAAKIDQVIATIGANRRNPFSSNMINLGLEK